MKKILTTIIIILIAAALAALGFFLYQRFSKENFDDIAPAKGEVRVLVAGVDYSGKLTDVLIYARFNTDTKEVRLLSIPRDSYIGTTSTGKINAVYGERGGITPLIDEVEKRFLLPVDYYLVTTLAALGSLVDEVGGVTVNIERDLYEDDTLLFKAGENTLNGEAAMMFVRLRHAYLNADLGRIEAQQQFLLALFEKLKTMNKADALKLLIKKLKEVDTNIPAGKALSLATSAFSVSGEGISHFTVPGDGIMNGSQAVYQVNKEALAAILNEHFLKEPIKAEQLQLPSVYSGGQNKAPVSKAPAPTKKPVIEPSPTKKPAAGLTPTKKPEEQPSKAPAAGEPSKEGSQSGGGVVGKKKESSSSSSSKNWD